MDKPASSVFIGQLEVSSLPCSLAVHGLGSCVALILCEGRLGIGGLAHVLLPGKPMGAAENPPGLPAKYAASALGALRARLMSLGAKSHHLRAAIVGGAGMFEADADIGQGIGDRNVESLRALLKEQRIVLALDITGGRQGRTVIFDLPECRLRVRTLRGGWTGFSLAP